MTSSQKQDIVGEIFKLELEKQFNCGDGTGKVSSHSFRCRCAEIDQRIDILRNAMRRGK